MTFQSTIVSGQAYGVPGEISFDNFMRVKPYVLNSASAAYNIVGATAYTVSSEGVAAAGGLGSFAGILVDPKAYNTADLNPSATLANGVTAELATSGEFWVKLPAAAAIGDLVTYNTTTGALGSVPALASGTGSISTTTLTVSAVNSGSAPFQVGQTVYGPNIAPNTVITAILTGTGGVGTYTVNNSQTAASGAVSAAGAAPSGSALVPNGVVSYFTVAGAGLANIKL